MIKKNIILPIIIILIIFSIGFFLRIETTNLSSVPFNEKTYYEDDNGLPYMYELDSYYNYRLTENLLNHGYIGDTKINGREWDVHSYYPPGVPMDYPPLIAYLGVFFYKFINIFGSVPLIVTCFWLPAIIGPLAGVVSYLFLRRFTNEYGAATAGILMSLAPYYFIRTVPGWYDTDMFNIIFPILTVWFFFEAFRTNNHRYRVFFAILASISMVLFSLAWNGWQYIFYLVVIFSLIYFIWCKIQGKSVKQPFYILGIFTVLTIILTALFGGFSSIINLIYSPLELLTVAGSQSPWEPFPYIYIMVSELSTPKVMDVILGVGLSFIGGILGLIWMFKILKNNNLKNKYLKKTSWFFYTFLIFWTFLGFITIFSGGRFIILLIPPLVVSTGLLVGIVTDYLSYLNKDEKKSKNMDLNKNLSILHKFLPILFVIIIVIPAVYGVSSNLGLVPLVNDDFYDAAQWINNSSNVSNDTVIITSWTWGHSFAAMSNRPVVFDGRMGYIETLSKRNFDSAYIYGEESPSVSREYWIDEALSTDNESLSTGIFKMLATSGDSAFIILNKYTGNKTRSVEILNNILGLNYTAASMLLKDKYGFNATQIEEILNSSHPSNPRPYILITNNGMITKGYWIFEFGIGWDIYKQEGKNITYTVERMNSSNNIFTSDNGVIYDSTTGKISWLNQTPYSLLIISHNSTSKFILDKNSDFSVVLLMDTNQSIVFEKGYEDSLFTKLVMEKSSNTSFQSIYSNQNVTIWKIIS